MPRVEAEVGNTANSYEILAKLAAGGMAEIFLARGASTGGVERYVVLKRILRHRANDQAFVRMFLDEARLAAQLQHPNIAQVYDIGKLGDSFFFTMEYVHGETVRALLQRSHALRSPIPIGSVLVLAAGSAAGLHHAHDRNGYDGKPLGIVHRDVSPSNLMVSYEGGVKVVDFGVAKAAHSSHETRSGTVKGKISYLSPEQCRGNPVDRRSDLFSLGIVLWEMLTTERLYKRASDFETMAAIVSEVVPPPSSRRADISRELDALVLRLLEKDPNARFQTADELHEAVETVAVGLGLPLSSPSLARYLRDLFGQRPEPWIEMQSRETHPEAFTVTSEPIPAQLDARPANLVESQLGAVPDLSDEAEGSDAAASPAEPFPRIPTGQPTTPFRTEPPARANELHPTQQMRASNPILATLHGSGMAMPPRTPPRGVSGPTGPQQPLVTHVTGPQQPTLVGPSGSQPIPINATGPQQPISGPHRQAMAGISHSNPGYPLYVPPTPHEKKLPRVLVIVLTAITLGIIVGIILAASGNDPKRAVAVVQSDAARPELHDAPAAVALVDLPADAAPPVVAPPVVAPPVVAPIDAASVAVALPVVAPADAAIKTDDAPSPADRLSRQLDRGSNSEAVTTCVANPALVGAAPVSCVTAACRAHDAAHAKRWYPAVGKNAQLVATCKGLGILLEAAAPVPPALPVSRDAPVIDKKAAAKRDCDSDPMACQH